jgi:hypothetical protein
MSRIILVAKAGLEPARPYGQQILSLVRLPLRHLAKKISRDLSMRDPLPVFLTAKFLVSAH